MEFTAREARLKPEHANEYPQAWIDQMKRIGIYGLAIPESYGGYMPRNFDGRFMGLVRMEYALSQSLNLPFVNLLRQLGVERFLGTLLTVAGKSAAPEERDAATAAIAARKAPARPCPSPAEASLTVSETRRAPTVSDTGQCETSSERAPA